MKKTILTLIALLTVAHAVVAQTQQGYVRTLGRPDKAGQPLSEVTIKVKGQHNTLNSGNDGTFEMILEGLQNGDAYALAQVQKNGYELNENDLIGRPLAFSDQVRLEIVMVSSAQLQADKRRIENTAYQTAEKNYRAQYDLLERQLNDNQITIERYREEIQELQDNFERYQSLIDGLAEHYAHTDYDLLDEKDREINLCIENGELERADSLIRLLFDPIGVLERNVEALARIEQQISQATGDLAQANEAMAAVLKQQEKDAEHLYQLFTIALSRFDNEKAQFYIETRAALDTTNIQWQINAGQFCGYHNIFDKAEIYYTRGLRGYRSLAKDQLLAQGIDIAYVMINLADIYRYTLRPNKSETLLQEAIEICDQLLELQEKHAYAPKLIALGSLGEVYADNEHFSESWDVYTNGIEIYTTLSTERLSEQEGIAKAMWSFFNSFYSFSLRDEAMSLITYESSNELLSGFEPALEDMINVTDEDLVYYGETISSLLSFISDLYYYAKQIQNSVTISEKALELSRKMASQDPAAHTPTLVYRLQDLASLYFDTERLEESASLLEEALSLLRSLVASYPDVFSATLVNNLGGLGNAYKAIGYLNMDLNSLYKAESMYKEAIEITRSLAKNNPQKRFDEGLYTLLHSLGDLYLSIGEVSQDPKIYKKSENAYKEAIAIERHMTADNPEHHEFRLATTLYALADVQRLMGNYRQCEQNYKEVLTILRRLSTDNPEMYEINLIETLNVFAEYKIANREYKEGISLMEESLGIVRHHTFLNEEECQSFYLSASILGDACFNIGCYDKALQLSQEMERIIATFYNENNETWSEPYVSTLGNESYYYILQKEFAKSEVCASKALAIDISQTWVFSNLAAALLLQGKYNEAAEIYTNMKNELKDSFLQDLDDLEAAGVIPKDRRDDVERIRKLLKE